MSIQNIINNISNSIINNTSNNATNAEKAWTADKWSCFLERLAAGITAMGLVVGIVTLLTDTWLPAMCIVEAVLLVAGVATYITSWRRGRKATALLQECKKGFMNSRTQEEVRATYKWLRDIGVPATEAWDAAKTASEEKLNEVDAAVRFLDHFRNTESTEVARYILRHLIAGDKVKYIHRWQVRGWEAGENLLPTVHATTLSALFTEMRRAGWRFMNRPITTDDNVVAWYKNSDEALCFVASSDLPSEVNRVNWPDGPICDGDLDVFFAS